MTPARRDEPTGDVSWQWVIGIWSMPSVLSAFATYANAAEAHRSISAARAVWLGFGTWFVWAPLTLAIVWLGQRWPLDRRTRWASLAQRIGAHLFAAIVVGVIATAITAIMVYDRGAGVALTEHLRSRIVIRAPMGSVLYGFILGVSYLAINTRRLREKELFAERLSRDLTEAQFGALRMQMQPHFLFNSLNAVIALVRDQATERADQALVHLSDVLRATLRQGTRPRIPLNDEVAFIRNYLEIETLRFGDRLAVTYEIPAEMRAARVPTFVLQPLVENALRHGIMDLPDGGTLAISAVRHGATLSLYVMDDGVGLAPEWEERARQGVGLTNVRARLAHMYGNAARLTIASRDDRKGTRATVELPFEEDTP